MLKKGAIKGIQQDPSLPQLIICGAQKGLWSSPSVINLKNLNHYILCSHFKMEGLFLLKETLQERD